MTDQKPDAEFSDLDDDEYGKGYRRGYDEGQNIAEQQKTDLTLAGAILIALIFGALGFIFGMVL